MIVRDGEAVDLFGSAGDLGRWLAMERDRLGECAFAIDHPEPIIELRDATRELLVASVRGESPPAQALALINERSARAPVFSQLRVDKDGSFREIEHVDDRDRMAGLLGVLARSAINLLSGPDRERLKLCTAPSCGMLFLGSRRWCCSACGNRARAARHYQRRKAS
jgi:predicted RNA-binding Zn ribbon-like protein